MRTGSLIANLIVTLAVAVPAPGQTASPGPSGAPGRNPSVPAPGARGQATPAQTQTQTQTQTTTQKPQDPTYKETVVVSASKTEQQLVDAPATMTVIGARALSVAPSNNYGDLLKNVPGVNITQISARDINVTSRGATSSLATSQLAVVDGRSIYQDFFGFTMWDFMPSNLDEIKRIEVIRGPASAVWGANALNGVINVITKSPREMQGTSFTLGLGSFNREVNANNAVNGSLFYARGTYAAAVNDRWAFKISAGTYDSDPMARPLGNIPNDRVPSQAYPAFVNQGTTQPKFDFRADYDFPDADRKLQFSAGLAATDGIMHTGIGPFDINSGTKLGYWKMNFLRKAMRLQVFMNALDGEATNLVSVNQLGQFIPLNFDTKTFDVELGDTRLVQDKHVLTYGGNVRFNKFDLTIAPGEDSRTEGGFYLQDEFMASSKFRVVAGARVDKFSSIDSAVFSPRVALVMKPRPDHSIKLSYNRAFRAPSMVNNNLLVTLGTPLPFAAVNPAFAPLGTFLVPTTAMGNPDLTEERIDAIELAFSGTLGNRAMYSVAIFQNTVTDQINFTQTGEWGPTMPPPGWPAGFPSGFPGVTIPGVAIWGQLYGAGIRFPSTFTYLNLGEVKSKGIELGLDGTVNDRITGFVNYSFQADPDATYPGLTAEQAAAETNQPSKHLFNLGASYISDSIFGSLSVGYTSRAFWTDVLDSRFHGRTRAFSSVNLTVGMKFDDGRYQVALKGTNLGNRAIQQHIFGDVIRRAIVLELRLNVPRN